MHDKFEHLINGESVYKALKPELTYRELNFDTKENMNDDIYSFLLYTGYLKTTGKKEVINDIVYDELIIPNKEVKMIYHTQFMD